MWSAAGCRAASACWICLIVAEIRRLITAWCHAILAVMLMSLATLNWLLRIDQAEAAILPWGLFLSLVSGATIALTSYFGGQLVYDHAVGVSTRKRRSRQAAVNS